MQAASHVWILYVCEISLIQTLAHVWLVGGTGKSLDVRVFPFLGTIFPHSLVRPYRAEITDIEGRLLGRGCRLETRAPSFPML